MSRLRPFHWLALLVAGLSSTACTPSLQHFGDAGPIGLGDKRAGFVMAPNGQPAAAAAVRDALVAAGYQPSDNGSMWVEVGFAVRPRKLAVVGPAGNGSAPIVSPPVAASFALCRKQAYVLTLAVVDRASGTVVSRAGAATSRCRGEPDVVLPMLVRAVLAEAS